MEMLKLAHINLQRISRNFITFNGSPMDAVSYVSVVLDASELSPSPLMLYSVLSLDSSFTIGLLSPRSFIDALDCMVGVLLIEINVSLPRTGDDSLTLSTSKMVETLGGTATATCSDRLVNGDTDLRPKIGSKRSSIESRGLIWPELQPLDSKKSKSFGFKITAKKERKT